MSSPLDDFWAAGNWTALERVNGWTVTRDGDRVRFSLPARDGQRYLVQLGCDGYPGKAPSVVFINEAGSALDPASWPTGVREFHSVVKPPPASFLCMPLTREGLAHHAEWRARPDAWNDRSNLLLIFNCLGRLLGGSEYTGRGL